MLQHGWHWAAGQSLHIAKTAGYVKNEEFIPARRGPESTFALHQRFVRGCSEIRS
jgi:hypothetical protein